MALEIVFSSPCYWEHLTNKKLRCAIDLFCTQASRQAGINDNLPDDWGWGTHTDEVRIHLLNGAHFSVFNSPYVQNFAKLLDIQLQNARVNYRQTF